MVQYFRSLVRARRETGASAVEYSLLVAALAVLIVLIVIALGNVINKMFEPTCVETRVEATTTQECR